MRVGIFSESYDPIINGVSASVDTLIDELRRRGHEAYVFCASYPGYKEPTPRVYRFPAVHTWVDNYPIPIPVYPGLTEIVRDLSLDVIHTQTPWILGWVGMRLARKLGIPLVSTNHTRYPEYAHYVSFLPQRLVRDTIIGIMRRYYGRCDAVVAPSQPVEDVLRSYGISTPMYVIPSGVDMATAEDVKRRADVRERHGIAANETVVLYVGRLAREKNLTLLMQAFERVGERCPNARLLLVGGGPYETSLRKMATDMTCWARISFAGYVPRQEVGTYYAAGDLFAFPSTSETQGLVVSEALSAGLPCVAVRAIGSSDVVRDGENGFLTDQSLEGFAGKIETLVRDRSLLRKFSRNAIEHPGLFSTDEMVTRMLDVYERARRPVESAANLDRIP